MKGGFFDSFEGEDGMGAGSPVAMRLFTVWHLHTRRSRDQTENEKAYPQEIPFL